MAFVLTVVGWLGETVLKSLIDKVWDIMKELGSHGGEGGECEVGDALTDLEISLIGIQTTICEAENIWIKDENLRQNMNKLLVLLKDAAYDAEDLLDKFQFLKLQQQIKQQKNEASDTSSSSSSSFSFLSRPTKKRKVGEIIDQDDVNEIRKIQEKVEKINTATKELLDSDNNKKIQKINEISRVTTSIPIEAQVFGRDNEMNELVRFLLEDQCGFGVSSSISVLAVTGIGGVGKSTLAQAAYNDMRVEDYFMLRMWVCVSEDFNVERLTKDIIESATNQKCDLLNLDALQVILKQNIISKKFLLVLDDVWSEDRHKWDSLCAPLRSGVMGSKILVTARNVKIANMVGNMNPIHLNGFDDDISWAFFKKCAFGSQNSRDHPRLEAIAKEMVPKLKGLPLAAKTLGGLLNMNMAEQHWKTIMDSEIWKLPQGENGVLLVLQLSYHYLPAHLKRCFAFCSLYPKDYMFDEQELVRIWMAEGFFPIQKNITMMEDFGSLCFQELVSRYFFQRKPYLNKYVMHDLVHDLAQLISSGETYTPEDGKPFEIPAMLRRLNAASIRNNEELTRMVEFHGISKLRTLICPWKFQVVRSLLTRGFFNKIKSIRTLILESCMLTEIPESVGDLIHLRYLDISGNSIKKLPNSLFQLYNLQTLILRNCGLYDLPESIGNLIYLSYLDISWNTDLCKLPESLCCLSNLQILLLYGRDVLCNLPQGTSRLINLKELGAGDKVVSKLTGVGNLKSLQRLSLFKVGKEHGHKLTELNGLTQLHGELKIIGLENAESREEAIDAKLHNKLHIDKLLLQWNSDQKNDRPFDCEELILEHLQPTDQDNGAFFKISEEVLEHLQPNSTLRRLTIREYNGAIPPSWLETESLSKLKILTLEDCKRWKDLSFIKKLYHLKSLILKRMPAVTEISKELYASTESNSFIELENLVLEDMTSLEEISIFEKLPCLKHLYIRRMPLLNIDDRLFNALGSQWFPSLEELELKDIGKQLLAPPENIRDGFFVFTNHLKCFPTLERLRIKNMPVSQMCSSLDEREWFPCLRVLEMDNCPLIKRLPRLPTSLTKITLNQVGITEFPGIQDGVGGSSSSVATVFPLQIQIIKCPNLTSLDRIKCLAHLTYLDIKDCPLLTRLPPLPRLTNLMLEDIGLIEFPGIQDGIGRSSSSIAIVSPLQIHISNCPNLTSMDQIECFTHLTNLDIKDCPLLTRLPPFPPSLAMLILTRVGLTGLREIGGSRNDVATISLAKLRIEECSKMISLEEVLLSYNLPELKNIVVRNCKDLMWMPVKQFKEFASLKFLSIYNCPQLMTMAQDDDIHLLLPPSIQCLDLCNCGKVGKSLHGCLKDLTTLTELEVHDCPYLVTLPREQLLRLEGLRTLSLQNCNELRSIEGLGVLKSLGILKIHGCPRLQPNGDGLGENIISLIQLNVDNTALLRMSPLRNTLPSIETLKIKYSLEVNIFEGEDHELLRSLTSLRCLIFYHCKNLQTLPTELHTLPSLQQLEIYDCAQICSLPEKGLPYSLKVNILFRNCHPTLEKQLKEHIAEIWKSSPGFIYSPTTSRGTLRMMREGYPYANVLLP